jgi:hypothetical protein
MRKRTSPLVGEGRLLLPAPPAGKALSLNHMAKCKDCGRRLKIADWPFCPHGTTLRSDAQGFIPPVVFVSTNRRSHAPVLFPGRSDAKCPDGYTRKELRTVSEIRAFEKQYGALQKEKRHAILQNEQAAYEGWAKDARARLQRAAAQGSPNMRLIAQMALAKMGRKDFSGQAARYDPGFTVEAFSYDQSNRERTDGHTRYLQERARR